MKRIREVSQPDGDFSFAFRQHGIYIIYLFILIECPVMHYWLSMGAGQAIVFLFFE